jgi:transcriptional regulator with XRE-family HTH domain
MEKFGMRLRRIRESYGISQSELARRIGRSASYVNLVESGQRLADQYPPWDIVRAMADALGTTDTALVGPAREPGASGIAERRAPYTVGASAGDAALGRAVRELLAGHDAPSPPLLAISWLEGTEQGPAPALTLPRWLLPEGADPAAFRAADDAWRARGVARGDIAIVDRARPEALDDRLLAVRADGGPVLGVCRLGGPVPRLVRPGHPDLPLDASTAAVIGPLVALIALGPR